MGAEAAAKSNGRSGRKALLSRIHIISRRELAMSDEDYRFCIQSLTGKISCTDMTEGELRLVLDRMVELQRICGFGAQAQGGAGQESGKSEDYPASCSRPQWRKIRWLQRQLRWNDENLRGYVKHVTRLDHERFLDVSTARAVISGLMKVLAHERKKGRV